MALPLPFTPTPSLHNVTTSGFRRRSLVHFFAGFAMGRSVNNVTEYWPDPNTRGPGYNTQVFNNPYSTVMHGATQYQTFGGFFRNQPIPRQPLAGDWKAQDAWWLIQRFMEAGVDGGFCDLIQPYSQRTANSPAWFEALLRALDANLSDDRFVLVPMIDANGATAAGSAQAAADYCARFLYKTDANFNIITPRVVRPSAYLWADGRFVIAAFGAESKSAAVWNAIFDAFLATYGVDVAFAPNYVNTSSASSYSAAIPRIVAEGPWGDGADTAMYTSQGAWSTSAASRGKKRVAAWMPNYAVCHYLNNGLYGIMDEPSGSNALLAALERSIADGHELAEIPTQGDFSEATDVSPTALAGRANLALLRWGVERWKTGAYPTVTRDAIILSHREHFMTAPNPVKGTKFGRMPRGATTPTQDRIYAAVWLTSAATIEILVDGVVKFSGAGVTGLNKVSTPLVAGRALCRVIRGGNTVHQISSWWSVPAATVQPVRWNPEYLHTYSIDPEYTSQQFVPWLQAPPVPDTTPPNPPASNLQASVSGSSVSLTWNAATDNVGVAGYQVHRSATPGFSPGALTLIADVMGLAYINTSVPGGTWYYQVLAYDAAGNVAGPSNQASATVGSPPDTTVPTKVTGLAGTVDGTTVSLTWSAATDNVAVTGYQVHRGTDAAFATSSQTLLATTVSTSTTDSPAWGSWSYRVVAHDAAGNQATASDSVTVTLVEPATEEPPVPPTPLKLSAIRAGVSVGLKWNDVAAASYTLYRSQVAGFIPGPGDRLGDTTNLSYLDVPPTLGTWYYAVSASDGSGNVSQVSQVTTAGSGATGQWPAGVATGIVSLDAIDPAGRPVSGSWWMEIETPLTWSADGTMVLKQRVNIPTRLGHGESRLAYTDQEGFVGDDGNPIVNWGYRFYFQPLRSSLITRDSYVQIPASSGPVIPLGSLVDLGTWPHAAVTVVQAAALVPITLTGQTVAQPAYYTLP